MTSTPTWCLNNRGSFASIHVILPAGTRIHCETDAVVTFSGGVEVEGVMSGGFWGSILKAMFGGESFFTTVVENKNHEKPGDVMLAAADPGGIELHQLTPQQDDLLLMSGAYVASDASVMVGTQVQRKIQNSMLSGTGFFLLRASGRGTVACAAYGSIHKFELAAGETRAVDNGHLVAWTANTQYRVGLANARGELLTKVLTSMNSGEGLMCHFTGPGIIYLQSHKPGREAVKRGNASPGVVVLFMVLVVAAIIASGGNYQTKYTSSRGGARTYRPYKAAYKTVGEF